MSFFLHEQAEVNPPASVAQIANVRAELNDKIPDAVVTIWRESNGIFFLESGVLLYATTDIAERNTTYEVAEYAPNLLLIGDDSGGNGFFIPFTTHSTEVIKIDLGAIGAVEGVRVATDLVLWASQGCLVPSDAVLKKPETNGKIDIILEQAPQDGLKGMLLIKQKFSLPLNAAQLKGLMEHSPATLLKNVYYSKYKTLCEEINQTQHCLKIERLS